ATREPRIEGPPLRGSSSLRSLRCWGASNGLRLRYEHKSAHRCGPFLLRLGDPRPLWGSCFIWLRSLKSGGSPSRWESHLAITADERDQVSKATESLK